MRGMPGTSTRTELRTKSEANTLAGRLKEALRLNGTNPNQVEVKTGIARQTLYAILRGQTQTLSWPILVQLCAHLGVRPEWMAEGKLPMYPTPALDDEEIQLIHDYREMSMGHRRDLIDIARRWADEDAVTPSAASPFRKPPPRQQ